MDTRGICYFKAFLNSISSLFIYTVGLFWVETIVFIFH